MITFQVEIFSDLVPEMQELFKEHWEEIANYKDKFPLNPRYDQYRLLDNAKLLHTMTAREDGKIIGYCVFIVMPHMHYQDCLFAMNDVIFVSKKYRHGSVGTKLLMFAKEELTKLGVDRACLHVKVNHDFSPLLERLGFTKTEYNYEILLKGA